MKLLLYADPKCSKSCSQTFPSVFENFSKLSLIPSNIVAPSSDVGEISADGWKARFFLWKAVKTALKLLYKRRWHYTLLNVRTSFLDIQRDKHTNIQTNKKHHCFSSPVAVRPPISTELCTRIEDIRPIFAHCNFFRSDPYFFAPGAPENVGENCPIAVFCL